MIRPSELIFVIATLLSLVAYNCWQYFAVDFFFWEKMLSLAIVGWLWSYYISITQHRKGWRCVAWVVMWWAIMNCWDEWFGDPTSKKWYEYFIALIGVYTGYLKYKNLKLADVWLRNYRRLRNLY